jgi:hypothetical protein
MNGMAQQAGRIVGDYFRDVARAWDRFWFTPADPATFCLIRVLAGLMLLYTHLVWALDLGAFFGRAPWISLDAWQLARQGPYSWSYLLYVQSPAALWTVHVAALIVLAMFALGLFSRVTSVLALVITLSYANRVPAALFGLDVINAMLAMYLAIGPSGACYSLDRLIARWRAGGRLPPPAPSISANVAVRLIQVHMCIVYLFAGLGKLQGESWWDGNAMWLAMANLEYQSIDMTWLAGWPLTLNLLTHLTIAWEVSYPALVWPRLTRPIVLALAVPLHLGIACFLGMITFGLVMLIGNLAFVPPGMVRAAVARLTDWPRLRNPLPAGERVG